MSVRIESQGIYHALPSFEDHIKGLSAIVTGSNGISGHYVVQALLRAPQRWEKIFCLSRRPPQSQVDQDDRVQYIQVDFELSPEHIASILRKSNVKADYAFFFSYTQPTHSYDRRLWSEAEELSRLNCGLLSNFLSSLSMCGITPRRILLQTGAKNYGGHLGPTKLPQQESDPRHGFQQNFYFEQEDILSAYYAELRTEWVICMPAPILGAVPNASMTLAYPLAIYACVCQHLGRSFEFPSDDVAWQVSQSMTTGRLNAYMDEWAILQPGTANQKLNICDSSAFTWEKAWSAVARWYCIDFIGPLDRSTWIERESLTNHRPYGIKSVSRLAFRTIDIIQTEAARKAWASLQLKYGLRAISNPESTFAFFDSMVSRSQSVNLAMDKCRKNGWHGYVDSIESLREVFEELAALKMIPPI